MQTFDKTFQELSAMGFEDYKVWSAFVTIMTVRMLEPYGKVTEELAGEAERIELEFGANVERFYEMYMWCVSEFEANSRQDLLGATYMRLGIAAKNKGQFFSPYSLCAATAETTLSESGIRDAIERDGFVSVNDPAVGGGAMLIAAFNRIRDLGFNPQTQGWFVGQDLSRDTGMMAYLQMCMLGIPGYVVIGDSLANEVKHMLPSPMNYISPECTVRYLKGDVPC